MLSSSPNLCFKLATLFWIIDAIEESAGTGWIWIRFEENFEVLLKSWSGVGDWRLMSWVESFFRALEVE